MIYEIITTTKEIDLFVIEKNVAPPLKREKYSFGEMEVGDSFKFDGDQRKICVAASNYGKRNGKIFSVRKENDHYRVWRTE